MALFAPADTFATHIRAADLYAIVNPFNSTDLNAHKIVRFTLTVYCDARSVDASGGGSGDCRKLADCAELDFGDGSKSGNVKYSKFADVKNNTYQFVYVFDHVYRTDRFYVVGYRDENRNDGIKNINGGNTIGLPFYVEMGIYVNSGNGNNQTPQLTIPPIDIAEQFRTFVHNPGAYDIDGDSVSYKPYTPQVARNVFVQQYKDPNTVFTGSTQNNANSPATYSVDALRGDVKWDAPAVQGLYNVAFIIEEWRTFGNTKVRISYTIRDMQINVKVGTNRQPVITVPNDVCVEPGNYTATIGVDDPDKDRVELEAYGEPLESSILTNKATVSNTNTSLQTRFDALFRWVPTCADVRKRPYQVFLRATDVLAVNPLSDVKSFFIYVVGPRPTGLTAQIEEKTIKLTWNKYTCAKGSPGATKMEVYRRVGCDTLQRTNCKTGMPSGYVKIGTVDIDSLSYVDRDAKRGNVYSYAIAASFVEVTNLNSLSYPSSNVCVSLPLIAPVITKVSFEGEGKNKLKLGWLKPLDIDTAKILGPYTYQLFRKKLTEAQYTLLKDFGPQLVLADSTFLDENIESATNYRYYVRLNYFLKDSLTPAFVADSSEVSTNVELKTTGISGGIRLDWEASTPWSNSLSQLKHQIWRKREAELTYVLIDSVSFSQGTVRYTYIDRGTYNNQALKAKDTVSYFVTTSGSYLNSQISPFVTQNNSFISKNTPLDLSPPCPPSLMEIGYECSNFSQAFPYKNQLKWVNQPYSSVCDSDIVGYAIYYRKKKDDAMALLVKIPAKEILSYLHDNLFSVSGCYAVTAVDWLGNESAKSNLVCVENCKLYELPNVFTPNGSGVNDLFRPIPPSPRFVDHVDFKVFNRWGQKVFETSSDIHLNWDGSGLPDGVYFYSAKVTFVSLDSDDTQELKGWIQIIR
jgi:gliding motility-associated-like protein